MRIFKLIIISFVVFLFILTIISLFIPSQVQISKAVLIRANKDSVMKELSDPRNWQHWYPLPGAAHFFNEEGRIKGIVLNENKGQYLVIDSVKSDEIVARYKTDNKIIPSGWKIIGESDHAATLQWYMNFHLRWHPWEKFSSLLLEKRYGSVMQEGLNKLKNYLESDHSYNK